LLHALRGKTTAVTGEQLRCILASSDRLPLLSESFYEASIIYSVKENPE
jgi:hypothetical protein